MLNVVSWRLTGSLKYWGRKSQASTWILCSELKNEIFAKVVNKSNADVKSLWEAAISGP